MTAINETRSQTPCSVWPDAAPYLKSTRNMAGSEKYQTKLWRTISQGIFLFRLLHISLVEGHSGEEMQTKDFCFQILKGTHQSANTLFKRVEENEGLHLHIYEQT